MGLFAKGKTGIKAKVHRTDLVTCSQSMEGKTRSYSQINMVLSLPNTYDVDQSCGLDRCLKNYNGEIFTNAYYLKFSFEEVHAVLNDINILFI